jgi:HAD superfamily hydrolase (TIGR01509 family)
MKFDAVLFDFDGTLADTEPLHHACWREVLRQAGIDLTWEYYRDNCIGVSDRDMIAKLSEIAAQPELMSSLWSLYSLKTEKFREAASTSELISQPVRNAIKSLLVSKIAVVSSCQRRDISPILRKAGLLPLIQVEVYSDDVQRLKPAPDPYLLALSRLGASRAVAFEDSDAGIASASAAGCHTVRVNHPSSLPALLLREGLIAPPSDVG